MKEHTEEMRTWSMGSISRELGVPYVNVRWWFSSRRKALKKAALRFPDLKKYEFTLRSVKGLDVDTEDFSEYTWIVNGRSLEVSIEAEVKGVGMCSFRIGTEEELTKFWDLFRYIREKTTA